MPGKAREVIRFIQDSRKKAGLDVSDRINLSWQADGDLVKAVGEHLDEIAGEVLATTVSRGEADDKWFRDADLGLAVRIEKA